MNYRFKVDGHNEIKVFTTDYGIATWFEEDKQGELVEHASNVKLDINRKYFKYHGVRVYLDDFLAYTPNELVKRVKSGDAVSDDLCATLLKYGLGSLKVILAKKPLERMDICGLSLGFEVTHSGIEETSNLDRVEYGFEQYDMFKIENNYKIRLVPINDKDKGVYAIENMYIHDLVSLMHTREDLYELQVA